MSSTSQKHKDFVAEPMGEKPVTSLAGIGEALGSRLVEKGFDKVILLFIFWMHYKHVFVLALEKKQCSLKKRPHFGFKLGFSIYMHI